MNLMAWLIVITPEWSRRPWSHLRHSRADGGLTGETILVQASEGLRIGCEKSLIQGTFAISQRQVA